MLKYRFSNSSLMRMKAVDPRLVILVATYMSLGKKDIGVTYGVRTQQEQDDLRRQGKSQVTRSKHIPIQETVVTQNGYKMNTMEGNAIDIVAYKNGKPCWDREYYKDIIEDMKAIVKHFRWENDFNFGWDFKTLNDPYHISVKEVGDGGIK